jgi:molybdate transport system regulatory protein
MRNHLPCTIDQIKTSRGAVRVFMHTSAGLPIVSRITRESQQLLGLKAGMQVLALCKATAVTVAPTIVAAGEVNLLHGQVLRRASSDSGEVTLQLAGGLALVGFAESTQELRLRRPAMAAVDEAAVVVGLAG